MTFKILCRHWEKSIALDRKELDLAKPDQIREMIRRIQPTVIINAAAYTAVDQAEKEESLAHVVNAEAPAIMAEEAKKIGAAVIHYSTDYVFDGTKRTPYQENDSTNPLNAYGRTKLAGEQAIQEFRRESTDFSHSLGVFHARQEFSTHNPASRNSARRVADRQRPDRCTHLES